MRRKALAAIAVAALSTTGCTWRQIGAWSQWHDRDPEAAEAFADRPEIQRQLHRSEQRNDSSSDFRRGDCSSFASAFAANGLPVSTFEYIAHRESGCNPHVYVSDSDDEGGGLLGLNLKGSNAAGWYRLCGLTTGNVTNASKNIYCAGKMYRAEGLRPWRTSRG